MKHWNWHAGVFLSALAMCPGATRADAPAWMHSLLNAAIPAHDDQTDAVVLYSEEILTVQSQDKVRITRREAYKILRPGGRERGLVLASFDQHSKVTSIRGWCIPAQGKDYEVKDKDAIEISIPKISGSEEISDVRDKMLQIPAAEVGNIVGFEYEKEESPLVLQTTWRFQGQDPVKDAKFTLQLPAGWEYLASWRNHAEIKPASSGSNQWVWTVNDVKRIRPEEEMPPWAGIAGEMTVTYFPPGGAGNRAFKDWKQMGLWYSDLAQGRRDASPEIKQKVAVLTRGMVTPYAKMSALAKFVQQDIRYIAIELGVGGVQPHPAAYIFQHRFGDCKDKATLMGSMLKEIGIESYYVIINSERGAVDSSTPVQNAFDHVITAVKLPDGPNNSALVSVVQHPTLGRLLFFDPTDDLTPFGQLSGDLQGNYGLLVGPEGGELYQLPTLATSLNGVTRTASMTLDASGNLTGSFKESRVGDMAAYERARIKVATKDTDRVKLIEGLLAQSLANFSVTHATMTNLQDTNQPFDLNFTIVAQRYAKLAGELLLVRPRLIGIKGSGLLETKDPRELPVIFPGPQKDIDRFEIAIPKNFEVDDLPPAADVEYSFASYHSKTEASGGVLKYTRTFEVKELIVSMDKMDDLKKFYRIIASDERNTAVLKPSAQR
jgi:Domain of Unknown Function with PDB structure (DUF3857)/Transglutaminase-like superfamily